MKDLGINEYLTIIGVAAGAYIVYKAFATGEKIVDVAKKIVTEDINPASDKNIAYAGANKIGSLFTGDADFNLGSWTYDLVNEPSYNPLSVFGASNLGAELGEWVRNKVGTNAPKSIAVGETNANFTVDHTLNQNQSFEAISKGSNFDVTDPLYYSGYVYTSKGK